MLPKFLVTMVLSSSRHRAHNADTKPLPGLWDKPGSLPRENAPDELAYISHPACIGQQVSEQASSSYSSLQSSL